MLDLGMLYFNRERSLTASYVLYPFVIGKNSQGLCNCLVGASRSHLDRMLNSLKSE